MSEQLEKQVKELIIERLFLEVTADEMDSGAPLGDYGVDSFTMLEVLVALEEVFGVKFEQNEVTADVLKNVGSLTALLESKLKG